MYRRLFWFEKVKEGDEVKNQFPDYDYTSGHGYYGMLVKDCRGSLTDEKRKFRRKLFG